VLTGEGEHRKSQMVLGVIVTNISGHDNNHPSDEKTLQKAPSLLVNKSLESHNATFILVLNRKQQFGFS